MGYILLKWFYTTSFNPFPANKFLTRKCSLLFTSVAYIQVVHFRLILDVEANTMNPPAPTVREHSDLGPYCLQYRLPKCISR